jgi:hypothetical protein
MDIFDPQLIFSPDKPFYPLVMSYVCQIHDFLDLASRGLYQRFERFCQKQTNFSLSRHELIQLFCKTLDEKNRKTAEEVVSGGKMGMMFKQGLASSISTGIKVDTEVTVFQPVAYLFSHGKTQKLTICVIPFGSSSSTPETLLHIGVSLISTKANQSGLQSGEL